MSNGSMEQSKNENKKINIVMVLTIKGPRRAKLRTGLTFSVFFSHKVATPGLESRPLHLSSQAFYHCTKQGPLKLKTKAKKKLCSRCIGNLRHYKPNIEVAVLEFWHLRLVH